MADISTITDRMLVNANELFEDNLASGISALATTVPCLDLSAYNQGDEVVFTVDPGTANQATGKGQVSVNSFINVTWTEGNLAVSHLAGATVIDYDSATHYDLLVKLIGLFANPSGTLKTAAVQAALNISAAVPADYIALANAPSAISYLGGKYWQMTFANVDYTDRISVNTKIRTVRGVVAPTQCTSLNGTTQYFSKTSPNKMTFTDDFVGDAYVKLSIYQNATIISRFNGTSGWSFGLNAVGQVILIGYNAGGANFSQVLSNASVPLNRWVRVSAQLDMSAFTATATTSYTMINGVNVTAAVTRGGTNPTALVQAGDLQIGALNGTNFFPGKLAQVALYNAKVTQANLILTHSQGLLGSETSLASAYSFNGVITDLNTTTPNDLTAQASAVATNADSPFGTNSFGIISPTVDFGVVLSVTKPGADTILVIQVPDGCTIPTSGGVTSVSYSSAANPYGFPSVGSQVAQTFLLTNAVATTTTLEAFALKMSVYVPANQKVKLTLTIPSAQDTGASGGAKLVIWKTAITSGQVLAAGQHWPAVASYTAAGTIVGYDINQTSGLQVYTVSLAEIGGVGTAKILGDAITPCSLTVEFV